MRSLSPEPRRETLVQIYCFWVSAPESTLAHQGESGISEGLREGGRKPRTPECSEFLLLTLVHSDHTAAVRVWSGESRDLGAGPSSATIWVHIFGQVCFPHSALFSWFLQWWPVPQQAWVSSTACQGLCPGMGCGALPSGSTASGRSGRAKTQITVTQDTGEASVWGELGVLWKVSEVMRKVRGTETPLWSRKASLALCKIVVHRGNIPERSRWCKPRPGAQGWVSRSLLRRGDTRAAGGCLEPACSGEKRVSICCS